MKRLQASNYIDHVMRINNIQKEDLNVAPIVFITWYEQITAALVKKLNAKQPRYSLLGKNFYTGSFNGVACSVAKVPIGAPGTVMAMEELIASGARTFIGIGFAGSLQKDVTIGSLFLPTSCLSEDGTSKHFIKSGQLNRPNQVIFEQLLKEAKDMKIGIYSGQHWSTDIFYHHNPKTIDTYMRDGIIGMDLETAAMFALGSYHDVHVANLLIISDELIDKLRPVLNEGAFQKSMSDAVSIALRAVSSIKKFQSV
ncbi:hypothetical protein ACFYKX_01665 [Cytobacillus sp. FJAT-54145]|uniref:Uridine phosphorylase n=1 Tax=Cytobacillus spartinae TaxID=3299023 RepID=A0ABW6K6X3_9BACI